MITLWLLACRGPEDHRPAPVEADETDERGDTVAVVETPPTWEPLGLCINELMPDNRSAVIGPGGDHPDWIELYNPTQVAVDLAGWSLTDDRTQPRQGLLAGPLLEPGAWLLLWADDRMDVGHLPFALDGDGEEVGLFAPDGRGSVVEFGRVLEDWSLARATDCCEGDCLGFGPGGTPGFSNVPVVTEEVALLPRGATWRYRVAQASPRWVESTFDDGDWPSGAAPLGYGDAQTTLLDWGTDPWSKPVTNYFRAVVDLEGSDELVGARLRVQRDDGAVVYWDGVELGRSNMPSGDVDALTLATTPVADAAELAWFSFPIELTQMTAGNHVIAVEVHQVSRDSSDVTFDLELLGVRVVPPAGGP